MNFADIAATVTQKFGLPAGYLDRVFTIESGRNPNALNASGAAGGFQFMPETAAQYGLNDPFNLEASTFAAGALAYDNMRALTKSLGRTPTAPELYLAHNQGAGGAASLLKNPLGFAANIVGTNAVIQNTGNPSMTGGDFAAKIMGMYSGSPEMTTYHDGNSLNIRSVAHTATGNAPGDSAAPSTVIEPFEGAAEQGWGATISDYFLRTIIIILGFIFVAVGLSMFKFAPAVTVVNELKKVGPAPTS